MRFAAFLLMMPGLAFAQTATNDLEYRDVAVGEDDKKKVEATGFFEVQWHEWNNLDFRKLDETSDQAILDSDDRDRTAFTGVALNIRYDADDRVRFVMGASHRGLWGTDNFGGTNQFGGWMYFNAAYLDIKAGNLDNPVLFRVGRQFYRLGGLGRTPDYMLADVVDMVRVDVPIADLGTLTLIPINLMSHSASNDGANFARFNAQSDLSTFGFRGDRTTTRHGAVLDLDNLGPAQVVAYGFYSDLGALGTGSDITYGGLLGNFSDNDWVVNYGVRGNVGLLDDKLRVFGAFEGSAGIDRKELVARDITTNGFAITAGGSLDLRDEDTNDGMSVNAYYYYALGANFAQDGLSYNHGYVGMKGQHAGGLLGNRFLGWHPSSYVDLFGIHHDPQDLDRKAGTEVLHASVAYERGRVYGDLGWWMMRDTGYSELFADGNFDRINTITPPFGYSREAYAAQIRHGRMLGQELNLLLGAHLTDKVDLFTTGALLLPGEYYSIPIARVAGTALGSDNPQMPWGLMGGVRVRL